MATLMSKMLKKMSFFILLFCIFLSFNTNNNSINSRISITTTTTSSFCNPSSSSSASSCSSSHSRSVPLDSFSNYPVSLSVKINGGVGEDDDDDDDEFGVLDAGDNDDDDKNDSSDDDEDGGESLQYDYYRNSCPKAERIVRSTMQHIHRTKPYLIPAILRLVFHDCFIQGCDASVLLDDDDYIDSEKEAPPNGSLKGFDVIETIKSKLEEACPRIVSCADILVLAARDSVALAGGPFYPLYTGRRDGSNSYADIATYELPSPYSDLSHTLNSFKAKGFDEREMVTLLVCIGEIHCEFFKNRLYNFSGTNEPDPSIEVEFLNLLKSRCSASSPSSTSGYTSHRTLSSTAFESTFSSGSPSSSVEEPGITMDLEQPQSDFGITYYRNLLQGRGILYADQQLLEGEVTRYWIKEYALDSTLFHKHFALAMMKLSDLHILTPPMGNIRLNCSKVA
ncbi:putative Peroxidase 48 [Arachis duranensis]|uniref:peroxidase n=1 Tax=Arachis duranensis TaxID=130453 RepID=A0A6P4C406_ARADU|nr:putative Peroxidase 48 [Arachis duranensis]